MAKVSITIDDTNPAIVGAFGVDSLKNIADEMGYMEQIPVPIEELPEMVEVPLTEEDIALGTPEGPTKMVYPEGTEFTKQNPQTPAQFVAQTILKRNIIPALLDRLEKNQRTLALKQVEDGVKQAAQLLESVAEVKVVD